MVCGRAKRVVRVGLWSCATLLTALVGCSPRRSTDDPVVGIQAGLQNGGVATDAVPEISAVGLLRIGGTGNCSATLIAPRVMITGAHCVFPGAMGCDLQVGPASVRFAGADGTLSGTGAQQINVVGISAHPDAYGNRVAACADPVPAPTSCPDVTLDPNAFNRPSCALLKACWPDGFNAIPCSGAGCPNRQATFQAFARMNVHLENDLALVFLEQAPVGINPVPVLTQGWSSPNDGIFDANSVFTNWVGGHPLVTVAGYGVGNKPSTTRDIGTMTLAGTEVTGDVQHTCAGVALPTTVETMWVLSADAPDQAFLVSGDSGGALMFGRGPVVPGVPSPSILPTGSNLCGGAEPCQGRFLAGVLSAGNAAASFFQAENVQWLVSRFKDFDGDGIPNDKDNCVGVANPDQANCNADAEIDREGRVLGDACDPVPCPRVNIPTPALIGPVSPCAVTIQNMRRSSVQLTAIGSHNSFNGVSVTDPNVATRFRFCQVNLFRGSTCGLLQDQRTHASFDAIDPNGTPPNNWLEMSFSTLSASSDLRADYPSVTPSMTWNYNDDRQRWISRGAIDTPPAVLPQTLGPYPAGLSGVIGIRGDTNMGSTIFPQNGVHVSPPQGEFPSGTAMARHYQDLAPETRTARIGLCRTYDRLWRVPCPACGISLPRFADCPTCAIGRPVGDDWWRARAIDPAVLIPGLRGRWGILDTTGAFVLPPAAFSPALVKELSSSLGLFVPRTEVDANTFGSLLPTATTGAPVQGAFISLDGRTMRGVVRASTLGFHLDGESFGDVGANPETPLSVAIPEGTTLSELALASLGGTLRINDRSVVATAAGAPAKVVAVLGSTDVGVDARVGSVFSTGDVELRDRARVDGAVVTEGSIRLHNGNVITGTRSEHAALNALDAAWAAHIPTATQGPVMLEPDLPPFALAPGSYAAVHVKSRRTLSLRAGTYYFDSLFVEPQAVLDIDNRTGPVIFYLRQGLTFRGRIVERNAALANLLFVARGSGEIVIEAPFRGTLVAPNAPLTLATVGPTGHTGAFFAQSIVVAPDVTIRQRPFTRPDCSDSGGCLGGWETVGTSQPRTAALGITARTGFAAVLSANLQALFVIGGRFSSGGGLAGTIVRHRLDLATTETVAIPGFVVGDVLAATMNVTDSSLWILDRIIDDGVTLVRLSRVDPIGRRFRTVWLGSESGAFDGHWLASGRDGDALLFTSSHSLGRYAAIRIKTTPFVFASESFQLLTDVPGVLAGLPVARGSGTIGYILEASDGRLERVDVPDSPGTEITNLSPWL